jgi:hypothetical protein
MALLLSLSRFIDSDGVEHWVEMLPEVAAVLAEVEPPLKERLLRKPEKINGVGDPMGENPFKLRFSWLLGESRTWTGDPVVWTDEGWACSFCWGSELPENCYCLGCDRCGRELDVPSPGKGEGPRVEPKTGLFRKKGKVVWEAK